MSGSVRDYAVLYLRPGGAGASSTGGGNAILTTGPHSLDGPEHVQKDNLHSPWTIVAGGSIAPTAGDPPTGEVVVQVKTTTGAPAHAATRGTPCWVAADGELYVNSDGATAWATVGGAGALVPYYIAPASTYTVPLYRQALFAVVMDVEGTLDVQGYLLEVD